MKTRLPVGLAVLLLCFSAFAQNKDRPLPDSVLNYQYAFVETVYGPTNVSSVDPRITPQDRHAVTDLETALRSWGRYKLTVRRSEADLVFVIRKGRIATANAGVKVSRMPPPTAGGDS